MTPRIVRVQGVKTPPQVPNPAAVVPFIELSLVRESKWVSGGETGSRRSLGLYQGKQRFKMELPRIFRQIAGFHRCFQFFHVLVSNVFYELIAFASLKRNDRTDGSTLW